MFGKILITIAVVALIWFGFRYLTRMGELRAKSKKGETRPGIFPGRSPRPDPEPENSDVQDMVKCPVCATYRPARQGSCGRGNCPY